MGTEDIVSKGEREKKKVRFDTRIRYHLDTSSRSPEEVRQCWWSQSETEVSKRICRRIAKQSRHLWYMAEYMEALYRLATSKKFCDYTHLESYLVETIIAKRIVECSVNFSSLRGLEYQVCDNRIRQSGKCRSKVCFVQHMPGTNDDRLFRFSNKYSGFDRIMARLLGEADALGQLEQSDCVERKRMMRTAESNKNKVKILQHGVDKRNRF